MCSTRPLGAGYTVETTGTLNQTFEHEFNALPGVKSAGLALYSALEGNNWGETILRRRPPRATHPSEDANASWDRVSPHFFETVGQPVIRGRGFTDAGVLPPLRSGRGSQPDLREEVFP